MSDKRCKGYVGVACVDGSCPMANRDEYEDYCTPIVNSCDECGCYKGCEDCALFGTEYCIKEGGKDV
ncbi:hypothetical protein [Hominenteromicrobium sp.]|jgi:hypothetical protein|uniref:hypothetical protein n=1 Tax=Hominenteromicrobium sp. TaxID=3073581 RepID=UPI00205FF9CF|nr:MAG TPA: hypothetical protein [Caudoviricetes sp.]